MNRDTSTLVMALHHLAMLFAWGFLGLVFTLLLLFGKWNSLPLLLVTIGFMTIVTIFMMSFAINIEKLLRKKNEELK